ncbi:MAG: hypothetical protein J0I64_20950 [Devosia sp.]|nr:hypothetical protein [Devosia sp.]
MGLDSRFDVARRRLPELCAIASDGLKRMALPGLQFPQTMRGIGDKNGGGTAPEGSSLRYAIIVAMGLAWTFQSMQRHVLGERTAIDLVNATVERAARSREPGAVALAAWAAAEIAGVYAGNLFQQLEDYLESGEVETVPVAWALTAALAAGELGPSEKVEWLAARMLLDAQGPGGLFAHTMPARAAGFARGHVGCFADQVYPIQALARLGFANRNAAALNAAEACAARIVALQGPAGQWWWHYDAREGSVVEGYPVYSVHQHAMAPMALLDLHDAGGTDHRDAIMKGLDWIDHHPETAEPIASPEDAMIWRKVGRREPRKLVRALSALTTAAVTGWHLPYLDAAFPPGPVDRECRPYEFGWMLYAWRSRGVVQALRSQAR